MVFSSAIFLFAFMPVVFLCHLLIRNMTAKNIFLLLTSLVFYSVGEPVYVLLMLASIGANYGFGRLVSGSKPRAALILAVCFNLALLGVFKYADFLIGSLNGALGLSLPLTGIELPIGISFFTFQALSYVIDVYRGGVPCQKNIFSLALYISFFPQLIAGPIVQYGDIAAELRERRVTLGEAASGLRRFIFGLSKKLLIANTVGYAADAVFSMGGGNAAAAWGGAVFYCLQIYFDFSGYSDMAIGLGHMFGFHFKENFDYPYAAAGIQDFWRRWHISLSTWFRDYLYIPLGGNRRGRLRTLLNRYIVFFCTGLWHGASWNFVIWGLIHGTALTAERALLEKRRVPAVIRRIYTLLIVAVAFVFFRAETLPDALSYNAAMFTGVDMASAVTLRFFSLLSPWLLFVTAAGIVLSFPVKLKIPQKPVLTRLSYAAAFALLLLCVGSLASSTFNPFIYFRF